VTLDARDAVLTVVRDADGPLHWTVILDRCLTAGYLDPFTQSGVRALVQRTLRELAAQGAVERVATGVYVSAPGP
jgi:hypothetical protein